MIKNRHIGRFSIPLDLINDQPSTVLDIMSGMIILKAEVSPVANVIDYTAIHALHFEGVLAGMKVPWYDINFNGDDFEFIKE